MMGPFLLDHLSFILEVFARAGGGGSSGGGGGSYSSSVGSSSGSNDDPNGWSLLPLLAVLGYMPMYALGRTLRIGQYNQKAWKSLQVLGWILTGMIALGLLAYIFLTGSLVFSLTVFGPIVAGAALGMGAGLYAWFTKLKQSKRVASALRAAEKSDYTWSEKRLERYAVGIFYKYQKDWADLNSESMGRYLSPRYQNHIHLMLQALRDMRRINRVLLPKISQSVIVSVTDSEDNTKDIFVIGFTATTKDQLIDTRDQSLLFQDSSSFSEYWRFIRSGNNWLLDGIEQASEETSTVRADMKQFAHENGMYYSPDWGWLLLPKDGYLFAKGQFGVSDINNHVIGYVNNVLTQLYTYVPDAAGNTAATDAYLVIQTNVPKNYGRILVKRRSKFINWPVAGLSKIKMEWGEFNDLYDVYASDTEKATSFELLNPAFMAHLRDLPLEVSIEVVDNVVYLFTKAQSDISIYKDLYGIVLKAHKEMKL